MDPKSTWEILIGNGLSCITELTNVCVSCGFSGKVKDFVCMYACICGFPSVFVCICQYLKARQ